MLKCAKKALAAKAEGKDVTPPKYYLGKDFEDMLDEIANDPM